MKRILYISLVDWFWIKQRPQHISEQLSLLDYKVDFLCIRSWRVKDKIQKHSSNDNINSSILNINPNLTVFREHVIPKGKLFLINIVNSLYLRLKIKKLFNINDYDYVILTHPNHLSFLTKKIVNTTAVIYDCMDNYKSFTMSKLNKYRLQKNEKKLSDLSKKIVVSSKKLEENMISEYNQNLSSKFVTINNGLDKKNFCFSKHKKNKYSLPLKKKYQKNVTYIGTISDWFNLELIIKSAKKYTNFVFYIVGPIDIQLPQSLPSNIVFTGSKPYEQIPSIIQDSDILIMPFIINNVVLSVNPVKIYEYLAMGKDVIAVRYSETEKFGNLISLYETENEFYNYLDILGTKIDDVKVQKRIDFSSSNSWEERAASYKRVIESI